MKELRLAIMGLGNVSLALLRYLQEETPSRALRRLGRTIVITGIATGRRGNAIDAEGIDIARLLMLGKEGSVAALNRGAATKNAIEFIEAVPADILIEATPATENGEPGITHIYRALRKGMSAVSANKSPIAWRGKELMAMARRYKRSLHFGATVLAGRYFFDTTISCRKIQAVLNATAVSVLTRMLEEGLSFEEGVRRAQAMGIAEKDSSRDTGGHDTRDKLVILVNTLMETRLTPDEIPARGIEAVTLEELRRADAAGHRIHLLGEARKQDGKVRAEVKSVEVDNPFFVGMHRTAMGVRIEGPAADVELKIELKPGEELAATATAIFDDLVAIARERPGVH